MPRQYNLNGIRLSSYPDGMENLEAGKDYQPMKYWRSGWNCTVVKANNRTVPYDTLAAVTEDEVEYVSLFHGYDDIDYSDFYGFNKLGRLELREPGCFVLKLKSQDRKILLQACRLDIPYDIGVYDNRIIAKIGDEIDLSKWKFSYFYYDDYLWDTRYDYIRDNNAGGRVSLRADYSTVGISGTGNIKAQYDDSGNGTIVEGDNGDYFTSGILIYVTYRDRDYTVSYNDAFEVATDWRNILTTNEISYIRRVGGSQLFCYMEDGTMVPFQRTGKNLYGYGAVQLSGVDYGSYMEVSVNGEDSVVMDYWQKRGIYVPKGV